MGMTEAELRQLHQLSRWYGIQTTPTTADAAQARPTAETLMAILRALGAPIQSPKDIAGARREARLKKWQQVMEPVAVAWEDQSAAVELRLPEDWANRSIACQANLEMGATQRWTSKLSLVPITQAVQVEGAGYVAKKLPLPFKLPCGYHRLEWEIPGARWETRVLCAPIRAYSAAPVAPRWGLFVPLYALHSRRSWGGGDLGDLRTLIESMAARGGEVVGTLPLLPVFLDRPFDPSPYSPISRLFWNEFYLDLVPVPEIIACSEAQTLLRSSRYTRQLLALRQETQVDYRRQMALKRRVLEVAARFFFRNDSPRRADFARFLRAHPGAEDYAFFRAAVEAQGTPWMNWPERLRRGEWHKGDYGEEAKQYHLYVQWLAWEQMEDLAAKARQWGVKLFLDLPLGVHTEGYDVWREQELFALEATTGAPPDPVFAQGQNWGFPPLHPQRIREDGYRYWRAVLHHHLQMAGLLRIDHVMGLHRLYWIPKGLPSTAGVYVDYPADELYALLCIESHRHRVVMVGENLGTVPAVVNRAIQRHHVRELFVLQYELRRDRKPALRRVPARSIAGLNTHDMAPFNAFWQGLDIVDRAALGLLNPAKVKPAKAQRQRLLQSLIHFLHSQGQLKTKSPEAAPMLRACLAHLSASDAEWVLINLEDLWLETAPQNVPGTVQERANWRLKTRYPLEAIFRMSGLLKLLGQVDQVRKGKGPVSLSPGQDGTLLDEAAHFGDGE